ncbi:MAG: ABC transporter permease [Candidatus Rokubacteria bacterium RIFCSPLOWO2_12_FULL_71_19]|nr:MAG: ABC transporter permease [Candidatus Rokubacteria bacterium RIFCSPLOWO2_12_FULL_71_19]
MNDAEPSTAVSAALPGAAARRRRRPWPWLLAAVGLAVLPVVPGLDSDFVRSLASQMGIAAIFALSFNMLLGQTGLLSFGHAVYFGLGGYVAIHGMRWINAGLPVPVALVPLFGAAGGLFFGLLIGSVTTKRAGTVFAMITLGLGELVVAASLMLTRFFGGEEGITANRTRAPQLLGLKFASQLEVYYLIAFWAFLSVVLMYAFTRTPLGRMCNAVRDNPERTEFVGYNPQRVRFLAFAVSAMFAGVAGGLHAVNYEIVAAEALGAARSGTVLLMAFIGGIGNFLGPILGAMLITWLQVSLSDFTTAWQLYFGILFIVVVLFAPGGLAALIALHVPLARARVVHKVIPGYLAALAPALIMALGGSLLLEINYRLATKPELGTRMTLFWVAMDVSRPWPWIVGVALLVGGLYAFRRSWALVEAGWQAASERIAGGGAP